MKRMRVRSAAAAALMLVSLHALGAATVHGVVRDQGTGQPLTGVSVTIISDCTPDGCHGFDNLITGADGSYGAADVHAGLTYVQAGYLPGQANYAPFVSDPFDINDNDTITFDIGLAAGVTIQGTVRRQSDQQPLANVPIVLTTSDLLAYPNYPGIATHTTDAAGHYVFTQLPAASYVVKTAFLDATTYQQQFYAGHPLAPPSQGQTADVLEMEPGEHADAVDFSLLVGGRLLGTLIDQYSGLPIANTEVDFTLLDAGATICCINFDSRSTTTDAQGHFELDGLPDASFHLEALVRNTFPGYAQGYYGCSRPCGTPVGAATPLSVAAGGTGSIDFLLYPNASVSGTVTRRSDGTPIQWTEVDAYLPGYLGLRSVYTSVYTDAQGHYTLWGAIAGPMLIGTFDVADNSGVAYLDQVYNGQDCVSGSCAGLGQTVSVPELQAVSSVDFQLDVGASIAGQVLAKDTSADIGAWIYVYASDGTLSTKVYSTPEGTFRTAGLQAGSYYLAASPYTNAFACTFYGDAPCTCGGIAPCVTPALAAGDAQAIVLGATDLDNLVIHVPANQILFADGFE